jgi:gamma-glutamylcyclotransferase (GGCT)/AIG2-like uncharacterized protein YtfP
METLFIYGTLLQTSNPHGLYLKNNSIEIGPAKFKGKLFNLGDYPGAIDDDHADGYVHGILLSLKNPVENLKVIDDYEGFGADQPQPNEFIRTLIDVESDAGVFNCWVYLYNLSPKNHTDIPGGRYLDFIP